MGNYKITFLGSFMGLGLNGLLSHVVLNKQIFLWLNSRMAISLQLKPLSNCNRVHKFLIFLFLFGMGSNGKTNTDFGSDEQMYLGLDKLLSNIFLWTRGKGNYEVNFNWVERVFIYGHNFLGSG